MKPAQALPILDECLDSIPVADAPEEIRESLCCLNDLKEILHRSEKQVLFFGAFKAGKTTLLNAIIGTELLPTRANRATGVATKLVYGPHPSASIVRLSPEGQLFATPIPFDDVAEHMLLDVSGPVAEAPHDVREVVIQVPLSILEDGIVLTDTPGLMDNEAMTERCLREMVRSDLAIMVLAADKLVSEKEREAASKAHQLLSGNVVFVVNRLDLVDDPEGVLEWVQASFKSLGNPLVGQPLVFGLSAKTAIEAPGADEGTGREDGIAELVHWLAVALGGEEGERLAFLSRLGVMTGCIQETESTARAKLAKSQTTVKALERQSAQWREEERAQLQRCILADRMRLSEFKENLGQLGERFLRECLSGDDAPEAVKRRVETARDAYVAAVYLGVGSAVRESGMRVPIFDPGEDSKNVQLPEQAQTSDSGAMYGAALGTMVAGPLGALVGGVIGHYLGAAGKEESISPVELLAKGTLVKLAKAAQEYVRSVEESLASLEAAGSGANSHTVTLDEAKREIAYYHSLLNWCHDTQNIVGSMKEELLAGWR